MSSITFMKSKNKQIKFTILKKVIKRLWFSLHCSVLILQMLNWKCEEQNNHFHWSLFHRNFICEAEHEQVVKIITIYFEAKCIKDNQKWRKIFKGCKDGWSSRMYGNAGCIKFEE